jgi:hypothetical protein
MLKPNLRRAFVRSDAGTLA